MQYKIQKSISVQLKEKVEQRAKEIGLSSLNGTIEFLLTNFANGNITVSIGTSKVDKYYNNILKEFDEVKYTANTPEEMFQQLMKD